MQRQTLIQGMLLLYSIHQIIIVLFNPCFWETKVNCESTVTTLKRIMRVTRKHIQRKHGNKKHSISQYTCK